jgi:hypothetical protein
MGTLIAEGMGEKREKEVIDHPASTRLQLRVNNTPKDLSHQTLESINQRFPTTRKVSVYGRHVSHVNHSYSSASPQGGKVPMEDYYVTICLSTPGSSAQLELRYTVKSGVGEAQSCSNGRPPKKSPKPVARNLQLATAYLGPM